VESKDVIWEGRLGSTSLKVGVPHSDAIIAEWDTPRGPRHKVSDSVEEFERSVLFQILLAGEADEKDTEEVVAAVRKAQAERPKRTPEGGAPRRRKNPRARQHRRSRTPPRRR
jgi:hypothetical protein